MKKRVSYFQKDKKQIVKYVEYTLQELYERKSKKIQLDIKKQCINCLGSGALDKKICDLCNGDGKQIRLQRMGPFMQQFQQKCIGCNGLGYHIITKCNACNKKGFNCGI